MLGVQEPVGEDFPKVGGLVAVAFEEQARWVAEGEGRGAVAGGQAAHRAGCIGMVPACQRAGLCRLRGVRGQRGGEPPVGPHLGGAGEWPGPRAGHAAEFGAGDVPGVGLHGAGRSRWIEETQDGAVRAEGAEAEPAN